MKKCFIRGSFLFLTAMLFLAFGAYAAGPVIDPAIGEFKAGIYTNKAPAFTVQFPANWFAVEQQKKTEIFRIISPHMWKVPVAVCEISDLAKDAPAIESDAAVEAYMDVLKKAEPQSSRHKIQFKEVVTLKDGTKGLAMILKWKYNDATPLVSAILQVNKGDKVVAIINSTVPGEGTTPEELLAMLKTLEFQ